MYTFEGKTIREHLLAMAEQDYKQFSASLNPGVENVLGIRVPLLRDLARRIAKADWQEYLQDDDFYYMEQRMLRGMVIGNIKMPDVEEYLPLVSAFVPIINSWSVCDTFDFCGRQRFVDKHRGRIWDYLEQWICSEREYEVRFGVVQTMMHFICEEYIDRVLARLSQVRHEGYYVKMAVAWALSVCYVKFPDKTLPLLHSSTLDAWTHNKTIQKICESLRVSKEDKEIIKKLKSESI